MIVYDGALAEFERKLIRERTQAGLQAARARGRKGGRPKSLTEDKQALAVKLYDEKQHTVVQICEMMGSYAHIPLNMLQKWMGHADMKTTAIYANAVDEEEAGLAAKMWE